jgi:hypothetical protein
MHLIYQARRRTGFPLIDVPHGLTAHIIVIQSFPESARRIIDGYQRGADVS